MSRAGVREQWRACAGFTIVEVLVALAVTAVLLTSIGAVAATSARASRSLDQRVALVQTARAVEAGIPKRGDLALGETEGEVAGHRWRMDVRAMDVSAFAADGAPDDSGWMPRNILIRVRSPSGATATIETVRLTRSPAR